MNIIQAIADAVIDEELGMLMEESRNVPECILRAEILEHVDLMELAKDGVESVKADIIQELYDELVHQLQEDV